MGDAASSRERGKQEGELRKKSRKQKKREKKIKYCTWQMEKGKSTCLRRKSTCLRGKMGDPVSSREENQLQSPQENGEKP